MSTLKVNAIRQTGASSDAVTLASDGTCTVKATNNLGNRNLIINGAMQCAQYGTSTSTNNTFATDRFRLTFSGTDEAPTLTQHALTSSDTGPWEKGFRYSSHIQNGNQTSGAGNQDYAQLHYIPEAQDIANSGWNYTSASSYVTLSFWVKSSVAQSFPVSFGSNDGTQKTYRMTTGSLSANTWTKVTKTIPGHADLTFNNDNGVAGYLWIWPFIGTEWTTSGASENSWATHSSGAYAADMTSTWWTTNDATFELTGVQLEVGDVATDFEHRTYADELARCQRYYYLHGTGSSVSYGLQGNGLMGSNGSNPTAKIVMWYPVPMRTKPSATWVNADEFRNDTGLAANDSTFLAIWSDATSVNCAWVDFVGGSGSNFDQSKSVMVYSRSGSNAKMSFSAEL